MTLEHVRLRPDTIKGIRRAKELARESGGTYKVQVDADMLKAVKISHRAYVRRLEEKAKEKQAEKEKMEEAKK